MAAKNPKADTKSKKQPVSKNNSDAAVTKPKASVPATPTKQSPDPAPAKKRPAESTDKSGSAKSKKSKTKHVATFKKVDVGPGASVPVDVSFEGDLEMSSPAKAGGFAHHLKLEAAGPFSLVKTMMFPEDGEHAGYQAIIIRPAKSFPFMKLSAEIRVNIYELYFASENKNKIILDGRRPNKEVYAKTYAAGSKFRVGILAASKEIYKEANPVLYAHRLRFETANVLLDFLSQTPSSVCPLLRFIDIKAYSKTTARQALSFLAEATNLEKLRIENGISSTEAVDVNKTVKSFHNDASRFLEAIGKARGSKDAGVDILEYGKYAFICKDGTDREPWDAEEIEEFTEKLRGRLK